MGFLYETKGAQTITFLYTFSTLQPPSTINLCSLFLLVLIWGLLDTMNGNA
jgi:hypothetical protein